MAQQAGVVRGSTKSQSQSQSVSQSGTDWKAIEQTPEFQELLSAKSKFIIPATIFFIVYYFALPVLVGYFPQFMSTNVVGNINIAYIFALSQFFMAWIIMALYIQQAKVFDGMAARIVAMIKGNKK